MTTVTETTTEQAAPTVAGSDFPETGGDTRIDPTAALVVIDLQRGIVALPTVHPAEEITSLAARLAAAFRARQLPVVLVNVAGAAPGRTDNAPHTGSLPADWAELVPELDAQPSDIRVTKLRWGAFHTTDLQAHLATLGVTQLVLCGIATSMGVESTARYAHEHGYNVVVVADAVTDMDPAAHENSLTRIFPAISQVRTSEQILSALDLGASTGVAPADDLQTVTA